MTAGKRRTVSGAEEQQKLLREGDDRLTRLGNSQLQGKDCKMPIELLWQQTASVTFSRAASHGAHTMQFSVDLSGLANFRT